MRRRVRRSTRAATPRHRATRARCRRRERRGRCRRGRGTPRYRRGAADRRAGRTASTVLPARRRRRRASPAARPAPMTSERRLALVGEQIERRADVVGRHPGVRHVAEEARRVADRVPHDLGPLVPRRRAAVAEEEVEQACARRAGPGAPARRRCAARTACSPSTSRLPSARAIAFAPVALEGGVEQQRGRRRSACAGFSAIVVEVRRSRRGRRRRG